MTKQPSYKASMDIGPSPEQLSYLDNPTQFAPQTASLNPFGGDLPSRTGGNLSTLAPSGSSQPNATGPSASANSSLLSSGLKAGGGDLAKKLAGKLGTKSLSNVGILGKMGKNPTPYGLAGMGANVLGSLIAKKHAKTGGAIGGAGSGVATGAMLGSVIPGIGTAAGAAIGGLIGGLKGLFGGKKKLKEKKALEAKNKTAGLTSIAGGQPSWAAGPLGPMSSENPYARLQAETEARYRNAPVTPIPGITPAMQMSNPWGNDGGMGGTATWGG